ncbi:MAG: tRNA (adenosine(37)-N6)-dimethylallyltransferase MiaA, partial [Acidobacteriota bacterium]|nr:tRNA (adenosine(37)-N6)-dimethylallyltransferase MiaA [Acidobacteriota bacterium]
MALVGVTASGKSRLAAGLARARPEAELVSVDSMAVYRGMDIGTAKPAPGERAELRYHLLDLVDPEEQFTLRQFQEAARRALAGIEERGQRALLVGGTALYLRAVVDALELPGRWPEVAAQLERDADDAGGVAALH